MRIVGVVQARMGSTRLPGKVLKPLAGRPMLLHIVNRLSNARKLAVLVVATSASRQDASIREICRTQGIACFAGHETDVLDRFHQAAHRHGADAVVRITGDCPLVDPGLVDRVVATYQSGEYDHVGLATGAGAVGIENKRFPDGLDVECFSLDALDAAWREAKLASDREHVTPFIWRNAERFRVKTLYADKDHSQHRWTVDNEDDFRMIEAVYSALYKADAPFGMADVLTFLHRHPEIGDINRHWIGKEQYRAIADPGSHPAGGE